MGQVQITICKPTLYGSLERVDDMAIRRIFVSPTGPEERELTSEEITDWANKGDEECRRLIFYNEMNVATTFAQAKAALLKWTLPR